MKLGELREMLNKLSDFDYAGIRFSESFGSEDQEIHEIEGVILKFEGNDSLPPERVIPIEVRIVNF